MARMGYFGNRILRPGEKVPERIGNMTVANIARPWGLDSHVAAIKRQNIVLDAAVIVARQRNFLKQGNMVSLGAARLQHFGATGGQHAAHAVKRYLFGGKDIAEVYTRDGVEEIAILGLTTMLGLVTDVDRRANLSIDKPLEQHPQRVAQLQGVVSGAVGSLSEARAMARALEFQRRSFEVSLLQGMQIARKGDPGFGTMLSQYLAVLSAPPPADEAPERMVEMITRLIT